MHSGTDLLRFDDISLDFADQHILRNASFSIEAGERVCLLGRNGAGKTTIFRILTGDLQPDSGEVRHRSDLRISQLEQSLPGQGQQTVYEYVGSGLAALRGMIDTYHELAGQQLDAPGIRQMQSLQDRIEASGGWRIDTQIETIISDMNLPAESRLGDLSTGWQRRVALARALVSQPELLLLDEPTNHLDLSAIRWLEDRIYAFKGSILFVSHDRAFLQRLATRILELDRSRLTSWPGDYRRYLIEKEKALEEEQRHNREFDKRLEQEETWIRQGIKARRTRNEGRVRNLLAMREVYEQRSRPDPKARIYVEDAEMSGRKVIEARNIGHEYGGEYLFKGLNLRVKRGDRIALLGNNGVGKSTLLRILLGKLQPTRGSVKLGTNLEIGYYDQAREQLDPEKSVAEVVGEDTDYVKINGRDRHVIGYLKGFLFSPRRAMTRISALSGGERNRVILAKLLTRPVNLLVLDEPTNDLDVETLEVLEEKLCEYKGTLIVVSHDREFIDNVVTSTLVFEEGGNVQVYAGGFSDWQRQGRHLNETDNPDTAASSSGETDKDRVRKKSAPTKLSYKLKRELAELPDRIQVLEKDISRLQELTHQPEFFSQGHDKYQPVLDELQARESELDQALQRWTELENMQTELQK